MVASLSDADVRFKRAAGVYRDAGHGVPRRSPARVPPELTVTPLEVAMVPPVRRQCGRIAGDIRPDGRCAGIGVNAAQCQRAADDVQARQHAGGRSGRLPLAITPLKLSKCPRSRR